jgi:hypothetical protein
MVRGYDDLVSRGEGIKEGSTAGVRYSATPLGRLSIEVTSRDELDRWILER